MSSFHNNSNAIPRLFGSRIRKRLGQDATDVPEKMDDLFPPSGIGARRRRLNSLAKRLVVLGHTLQLHHVLGNDNLRGLERGFLSIVGTSSTNNATSPERMLNNAMNAYISTSNSSIEAQKNGALLLNDVVHHPSSTSRNHDQHQHGAQHDQHATFSFLQERIVQERMRPEDADVVDFEDVADVEKSDEIRLLAMWKTLSLKVKWMYGNAGLGNKATEMNPFRWSKLMSVDDLMKIIATLDPAEVQKRGPIKVQPASGGGGSIKIFSTDPKTLQSAVAAETLEIQKKVDQVKDVCS